MSASGRCIILPIFWTWNESEADRSLMDVRTGCWDVRTDASWNRIFSIQWRVRTERHIVRTDGTVDRWASRQDGTSSERLTGNLKSSTIFVVQSLLKMLWQVESLFTASLHISDFVQTQNEAKILTVFFKFRFYNILLHSVHTHTVKLEVSLFFRLIKIFGNVG
jgi:hypothetical protein